MKYVDIVDKTGQRYTVSEGGTITLLIPVNIAKETGSPWAVTGHMDITYVATVERIYEKKLRPCRCGCHA